MTDRRLVVGSSEIAAVAGIHPYLSAFDVWASKQADAIEREEKPEMRWGKRLEGVILDAYQEDTGTLLERLGGHEDAIVNEERPWQAASPDAVGVSEPIAVEAKNSRMAKDWGEAGSSDVPPWYLAQVQWQLDCLGLEQGAIAALISGSDFRIYPIRYDEEVAGLLREKAERFVVDNLRGGIAPPISATAGARAWLRRFRADPGLTLFADGELEGFALALKDVRAELHRAEEVNEKVENLIKARMAEAVALEGPDFKITWKPSKPRVMTKWEEVWRRVLESLEEPGGVDRKFLEGIRADWTTQAEPSRPFRVTFDS